MTKSLLIVESPAKAKTIGKYLGPDFEVKASVGHIIDLPASKLGVDIEGGFKPDYVTITGKEKVINELKKAAKGKKIIYLGPDPDREGEAIAWHIAQALGPDKYDYKRVLLHELTPSAIKTALANPVPLSQSRFESQQTRRILDRLVGYLISPILWDKVKRGLSAGRVQSVALRLIVERERAIIIFVPDEYWSLTANLKAHDLEFGAALSKIKGKKAALKNEAETQKIVEALKGQAFKVDEVATKERKRRPLAPFTTSTLQQAAFNRLKLASNRTMRLAQELYEHQDLGTEGSVGLITYMRTDSVRVNDQAQLEASGFIQTNFGAEFKPKKPNFYKNKKGAQDAHEAIRPTNVNRTPTAMRAYLSGHHWHLYDLIWRRFVASQMAEAVFDQTSADIRAGDYTFRATGSALKFKGFLSVYEYGDGEDKELLPPLTKDQELELLKLLPKQHFTQPPPRFTEATLVKELEDKGIGRPSTYASIISTLKDKEYVEALKDVLKPTEMGLMITDLLVDNFAKVMDVAFTAGLEENLDEIEEGRTEHQKVLEKLYGPLALDLEKAKAAMINLKRDGLPAGLPCPACQADALRIRYGRHGFYLACGACEKTSDFIRDEKGLPQVVEAPVMETEAVCEKCGRPMVVKKGRYGNFLACSGYPECKNAQPLSTNADGALEAETPPPLPEGVNPVCEKCGGNIVPKKSRAGSWFLSCDNYPKCKNAKPFPSGIKCPKDGCDGEIIERRSKRGPFYSCGNYPKCRTIVKGKPVNKPCPQCSHPFLIEKPAKGGEAENKLICPAKECGYEE